ncbi:hypothetical protein NU219Hw_g421t1 [Hortaea werneckii]
MDSAIKPRAYRSSKRNKPCDRCEQAKVACSRSRLEDRSQMQPTEHDTNRSTPVSNLSEQRAYGDAPWEDSTTHPMSVGSLQAHNDDAIFAPNAPTQDDVNTDFSAQISQSLEGLQGCSAHLFGTSSESDPWLWRHCKFDDFGMRFLHHSRIRNAGGVPLAQKIPVHFNIESIHLHESARKETNVRESWIHTRDELNCVVPLEYGARLVVLFFKHVFPVIPVVSRSQLGMSFGAQLPSMSAVEQCPVHLLAAIYALSLRFTSDDGHLAVWSAQTAPCSHVMWRLVYEKLQEEIHQAQLSVVQATLLYLHKEPSNDRRHDIAETPFVWAWTGKLVGLATSLGLHIECSMWAIPSWEKRLRKRLWWAVYAEDKWRSLLMGRPPYTHRQEWDVEQLNSSDFEHELGDHFDARRNLFIGFSKLSEIAEAVQETFYSLRASQKLSVDMSASLAAATPLLERLNNWRSRAENHGIFATDQNELNSQGPLPTVHFAYRILILYVYRALLRPMVQSASPPHIIDLDGLQTFDCTTGPGSFTWNGLGQADAIPFPAPHVSGGSLEEVTKDVTRAANECAAGIVNFVRHLSVGDMSEFWHSWSRLGYAVVSNFIVLLIVQAPSAHSAQDAKHSLDIWTQTLRAQCRTCSVARLGMLRLNTFDLAGLAQTFYLAPHVKQGLGHGSSNINEVNI